MGYTHYWERPQELDQEKFATFSKDVKAIFEESKARFIRLSDGLGATIKPIADSEKIEFNGRGNESYETFYLPRVFNPQKWLKPSEVGLYFQFCKTNRQPYDLTVMAVLVAFKHHFENVTVTSDGKDINWTPAKELCNKLFGYGNDFVIDKEITLDPVKTYGLKVIEINDLSELLPTKEEK